MRKFIKPGSKGLLVRDPISRQHLNAEGEEKEINDYWTRRIMCGDVVEVEQPEPVKAPKKDVSKESKEA